MHLKFREILINATKMNFTHKDWIIASYWLINPTNTKISDFVNDNKIFRNKLNHVEKWTADHKNLIFGIKQAWHSGYVMDCHDTTYVQLNYNYRQQSFGLVECVYIYI